MRKKTHKPDDPPLGPLFGICALLGFLAALLVFFQQPSVLGLADDAGPLNRFADLFSLAVLGDQMLHAMSGYGRMEVGIADRLPLLLGSSLWLLAAWSLAWPWVQRITGPLGCGQLEQHALAILSGLAILSTWTLLCGLAGWLDSRYPLALGGLALGLLSWSSAARRGRPLEAAAEETTGHAEPRAGDNSLPLSNSFARWLSRLVPVAVGLLAAIYVLGSLLPPWEFDVLEYHLQAPKEFAQRGAITFLEHNIYANMPLAAEMHALAAMVLVGGTDGWWWGGLVGKTVLGIHSIIAAALLGGFIARRFGRWYGWAAAGLLLAAPGNAHVAMAGLIDMVLATYLLAFLILATENCPRLQKGVARPKDLLLTFQMAGMAAACKYTGLVFVVLPAVVAFFAVAVASRQPRRMQPALWIAVGLALTLTCVPWYLKNWVQAGNPFYPLATETFGGRDVDAALTEQWQAAHSVPTGGRATPYSFAALAASLKQLFVSSQFLHPSLTFLLLAASLLLVTHREIRRQHRWAFAWLGLAAWILLVWWLATHRIDRFWLPVLPVWTAVGLLALAWIGRQVSASLAATIVLLAVGYGSVISAAGAIADNRFFVKLSAMREAVGDDQLPGRIDRANAWINTHLDGEEGVALLIGEAAVFDYRVPILYATCFDDQPAEAWLAGLPAAEARENLRRAKVRYVVVDWDEIARYRSPGNYGFSDWPQPKDIERLVDEGVLQRVDTPWGTAGKEILRVPD